MTKIIFAALVFFAMPIAAVSADEFGTRFYNEAHSGFGAPETEMDGAGLQDIEPAAGDTQVEAGVETEAETEMQIIEVPKEPLDISEK